MPSFTMPTPTREEMRRGIVLMLFSVAIFGMVNALVKLTVADYPVVEVVFFRCLFATIPTAVLVSRLGGLRALHTRRLGLNVTRGVLHFLSLMSLFTAFELMPLADAIAISFAAPLFYTVLSIPLLGERVGRYRWSAVIVGFLGVLVMVKPGPGVLGTGAPFAVMSAFCAGLINVNLRRMSVTETSVALVFYQLVGMFLLSAVFLPLVWVTPALGDALVLAVIGLLAGTGQYWLTLSFRHTPAAVAAPFQYTAMIWAMIFGFVFFADLPTASLLGGAAIVAASGLFILYRETVRRRTAAGGPAAKP
ncbi:MAG: DMT family transporter [Proteobacteria bacterium]|nr:DMT family transporter [Pseudomonadota bacterium]